jgi:hypothetical protein
MIRHNMPHYGSPRYQRLASSFLLLLPREPAHHLPRIPGWRFQVPQDHDYDYDHVHLLESQWAFQNLPVRRSQAPMLLGYGCDDLRVSLLIHGDGVHGKREIQHARAGWDSSIHKRTTGHGVCSASLVEWGKSLV